MIDNKKSTNTFYNVAVFASAIMIIGGLVAIPAFTSGHAQAAVSPKDFKVNVKDFVKKIVVKFFNRGGSSGGGTGD
jgi:hypothetical protein